MSQVTEFDARSTPERIWVLAGGVLANLAVASRPEMFHSEYQCLMMDTCFRLCLMQSVVRLGLPWQLEP